MAYRTSDEKTISVDKIGGGWLVIWSDPSLDDDYNAMSNVWPHKTRPATSGRELYTDKKKLLKRLADFI